MRLFSGKNAKIWYFANSYWQLCLPAAWLRWRRTHILSNISLRPDFKEIEERVNYYCKDLHASADQKQSWASQFTTLNKQKKVRPKVYYLDSFRYARWFSLDKKWNLCPGDVNYVPEIPSIVKSRPIGDDNQNGVLMKLDKVRHFVFLKDTLSWEQKKDMAIFRGAIGQKDNSLDFKKNRYDFLVKYFDHPMCDLGEVSKRGNYTNEAWKKPIISLYDHLKYKFILALEGNDVASNLKWVMSSNSIAVMPIPKYETWFMEGLLVPDYHYIAIADDYSDLEEKLQYYINHPEKAKEIIQHAHEWVEQFRDKKKETIISLRVLEKYFEQTNL